MSTFAQAPATMIKATAFGLAQNGAVSIPGLQVGDVVVKVIPAGFDNGFENVIGTADQIQQSTWNNLDWSSVDFTFYFLRGV